MNREMPVLAIQLYFCSEEGNREIYTVLTVNMGEFISAKNCTYIDTNNNPFADQLLKMGFCSDTGFTKQSGFCTYPLWEFDEGFLKEIDVHGLYDIYETKFNESLPF